MRLTWAWVAHGALHAPDRDRPAPGRARWSKRPELEATYYLGLMMNVYCHADAAEQAKWFGDDIRSKADVFETLEMNTARNSVHLRRVGSHGSGVERAKRLAAFPVDGHRQMLLSDDSLHARASSPNGSV